LNSTFRRGLALVAAISILVSACEATPPQVTPAGSSQPLQATAVPTPTTEPAQPTIEVTPAAVLLTGAGQSHALAAVARGADGASIGGSVNWISSDTSVVAVDASGTVSAVAGVGTVLVTASLGELRSEPVYVSVASPVPGATLITDAQIVGGPTLVAEGAAEPTATTPYEVVLHGVAAPAAGTIVIGSEGRSIGGRVVSATPEGGDVRVRLVTVPPTELFTSFAFKNSLDLAAGPFEVDPDLATTYNVEQDGNSFTFTPRPTGRRDPGIVLAAAQGTTALPPLPPFKECEATIGFGAGLPVPLSLSVPPTFSISAAGTVDYASTEAATTVTVHATPTIKLSSELEIKAAFEAKVECKLTLVRRKFRVPGWAGLFFGGDVEFGVGFEVGGKVTLLSAKVGGSAQLKSDLAATLNCPATADCALSGTASAATDLTPTLQAPSLNQAAFEPSVNLFGFVTLEAGNADIEKLQFTAIEAKAGAELGASLTFEALQIDNRDPDAGRAKYALAFKAEVGPGI
jgi:hypothetical protein